MLSVKKIFRQKAMPSSLEYVKRFSMCNCLTIPMPDTYTAMAMTIDFLVRKTFPGEKVVVDMVDQRPEDEARAFKVPARIDTFLFSPFNESFHESYKINGTRYTCVGKALSNALRPLPRRSLAEFSEDLLKMDTRVDVMWGLGVLKILVLYDSEEADVRDRLERYDEVAVETLDWPVVQVKRPAGSRRKGPWHHYSEGVRLAVLEEIKTIERGAEDGKA